MSDTPSEIQFQMRLLLLKRLVSAGTGLSVFCKNTDRFENTNKRFGDGRRFASESPKVILSPVLCKFKE